MKSSLAALGAGIVFGVGLGISGMAQPAKVLGFLDVFGAWDPSLMFVMGGAVIVHFALSRWIRRRERPLLDAKFHLPTATRLDKPLIIGSAVFGIGWGLGGYCPGPAIVSLGSGALSAFVFVAAMALGMAIQYLVRMPRTVSTVAERLAEPTDMPSALRASAAGGGRSSQEHAPLPDGHDVGRGLDVDGGVAVHEQ